SPVSICGAVCLNISRMRDNTNHADFCVIPNCFARLCELIPFEDVVHNHIAQNQVCKGSLEPSNIVPTVEVKFLLQPFSAHLYSLTPSLAGFLLLFLRV